MYHWSNDDENSALYHRNKLHFTLYSNRKQLINIVIIFHNITVFTVFLIKLKINAYIYILITYVHLKNLDHFNFIIVIIIIIV